jgi:hypothetical protein
MINARYHTNPHLKAMIRILKPYKLFGIHG